MPRPPRGKRLSFEALESRILLSADPLSAGSLLVVDGSLEDQADLLGQFFDSEVLVLDQDRNGLEQISEALAAHAGDIAELHIISHGWNGSLSLGSTTLDAASLEGYQAQLQAWAEALCADADILFYGCNVAADEAGMSFIEELSRLTSADIAASTDLTGSAELGGDWELEYATGSIEADALAASMRDPFVLATINYDAATGALTFTADVGQADLVTVSSPTANTLSILVANGDTIVLSGDATGNPNFTPNGTNTQLTIANTTTTTPITVLTLLLDDQNDTVNLNNSLSNGLGSVSINGGAGTDAVALNSTTLAGNLDLGTETVSVAAGASINVGTNAISAPGSVTFAGASTVAAATFNAGTLSISSGIVALNAATTAQTLNLSGGGTLSGSGDVTVTGLTTWSGGTMSGTGDTNTDGGLNINGTGTKTLAGGRTLNTAGITTWSGAGNHNQNEISLSGGSVINNNGTWDDENAFLVRVNNSGVGNEFNNNGTYNRSGLGGETQFAIGFDNAGTVNVNAGLALGGGGTSSGSFSGASRLELSGGTHTLTATSSITTANATFSSDTTNGTFNINGAYDISDSGTTQVTGSTVNFNAPAADLGATLLVSGGTANLGTTVGALATLTVSGGILTSNGSLTVSGATTLSGNATIRGSGTLTTNGAFIWSAGAMGGTGITNANGDLNINTAGQKRLEDGRTLNTAGTTTWSGSNGNNTSEIIVTGGSDIVNNGTWDDQNTHFVRLLGSTGGGSFTNNGIYTRSGATGETHISVAFNNTASGPDTGVVNVNAGRLALGGGGTSSGSFSGAGALELSGGTHTLTATSSITTANATFSSDTTNGTFNINGFYDVSDSGTTQVTGSTVNFNAPAADLGATLLVSGGTANLGTTSDALAALTVSGGTLTSNGTLTVSGATTLTGGTIQGSGTLTANGAFTWSAGTMGGTGTTNANGDLNINTAGQKRLEDGRTLNTAGTTTWSGSNGNNTSEIIVLGGSDIVNNGTWNDQNTHFVRLLGSTGGGSFTNNGIYTRSGATGETHISVTFNNTASGPDTGVVNVNAGRLALGGGGTSSGSFSGAGALELSGGTHTLTATSSITTAIATFSSDTTNGTFHINGAYDISDSGTTQVTGSTVNFNAPAADLGATLLVSGGTANLGTTSDALATLTVSGGTLTSNGTLTVSGATTLTGGAVQGSGTLTGNGAFTWSAGTMGGTGTTNANGDLDINTAGQKILSGGRTLNTAGTTIWSGSNGNNTNEIIVTGGSDINNNGTWNDQNAHTVRLLGSTGGGSFTNNGTYTRSGATGETQISVAFHNTASGPGTGIVNVNAGTLALGGGGTSSGSFSGAGTLELSGGTHTLTATSSITTANATFSADTTPGTFHINGAYDISDSGTTQVTGSTVNFNAPATDLGATLLVSGGTANLGTTSDALATLTVSGGTLTSNGTLTVSGATTLTGGTVQGSGTLTANGAFTWSAGTMGGTGTTNANGDLNINTAGQKRLEDGRTLITAGTTTWSGSTSSNTNEIIVLGGSDIVNSGTWNDQNTHLVRLLGSTGGGSFTNNGTYTRSGATGETQISVVFDNTASGPDTGVVNVDAGRLALSGGGTHTGGFATAVGTTLEFSGGTHNLNNASAVASLGRLLISGGTTNTTGTLTASGLLQITNGTMNAGGTVDATTYSQSGGTLAGLGTVNVSGLSTWTGGTMTGAGTTNANGGLTLSGVGTTKDLTGGRTLNNTGAASWTNLADGTGQVRTGGGATINNSGTWNDQGPFNNLISNAFGGAQSTFNNTGTYTKSGAGTTNIAIEFNNAGIVNVNASTLTLAGGGTHAGSFATAAGTTLEFSGGTHNLNNASAVDSSGRLLISGSTVNTTGTLATGGLLQMTTGTLNAGGTVDATAYSQSGGTLAGLGTVNVSGLSTWTGGTMTATGTTNANGGLSLSGGNVKDLTGGRTLNNAGAASWTNTSDGSGQIRTGGGATINNSGTWNDQGPFNNVISNAFGGAQSTFNNTGTYNKSGAGTTNIALEFNNTSSSPTTGIVNISGGTLNLSNGGESNGSFNGASGTTLQFGGGTHDLSAASIVDAGNVRFSNGTTNLAGSYMVAGTTTVSGGTASFTGTVTNEGGALEVSSGAANFNNSAGVEVTTVNLSGGQIGGAQSLTASALFTWTAGTMTDNGTTNANGGLSLSGANVKDLNGGRTLNNTGAASWTNPSEGSGQIRTGGGATINNSGTWNDQGPFNNVISNAFGGAQSTFNNTGTFTKSGPGTTNIAINFTNSGILEVDNGTLQFTAGFAQSGTIDLASGTTLRKSTGGLSNNGGGISGSGFIDLDTGTLTNSGTIRPGGLDSTGLLTIEGNLTLATGSVIDFDLAGPARGTQYDAVNITGNVSLTGVANIFHLGGFVPTEDDAFQVIRITPSTSGNVTGTFTTVNPPPPPPTFTYATVYGTDDVTFHLADNQPPVASNDTYTTVEDTALTIAAGLGVLANDTDPDLDSLTAILETNPAHGTLTLNPNGSFTYTPHLNFFGSDSFTYRASDGPLSDAATVSLTISAVNDAPVANNDSATTNEDFAVTVFVRNNDTDVDFNGLTVSQFSQGTNGVVTLNAGGNLVYTPNANFFGSDIFTYRVRDNGTGLLESNEATVTVTVAPVADFSLAFLTPTSGIEEGGGAGTLTLVLTTDTALNSNVTVDLTALGSGSALLGSDYTFTNPTTLTFVAGSVTGATRSATLGITNDRGVETLIETADFSFGNIDAVGLGVNAGPTTGSHTLSITDNDSAAVAITAPGTTSVTEGGASANVGVTLTLTTDGVGTEQLDVELLANLPGNGDYAATAALFGVGSTSGATADVVVTAVNDLNVEQATETFAGQAFSATSAANVSASTSQTIAVTDNDSASVVITAPGTTILTEGGGSANVGVTLMLTTDGTVGTAQLDVAVAVNLPGNADYTATGVTFAAGAVSGATADVVVGAVNDRRVEQATESFAAHALSLGSTANTSTSTSQTIEVTDNDSAAVAITAPGTTGVVEGGTAAGVSVTLSLTTAGVGTEQLDVELLATLPGNGDYTATAALFGVGAVDGATADVMVAALNDRNVEQATESFAGQVLSATSTANVSASTSQTINVVDNDSASVAITTPGTTSVTEGDASANVNATLTLTTDGVGTEQLDVAVSANLPGNGDYEATAAVFAVGTVNGATADVVVAAVNDRRVEQAVESFAGQALSVTSTANVSAGTSQTINVVDNDSASVAITTPGTTSVIEGGTAANVGVTLSLITDGVGTDQLDVAIAASLPGNGDYAATAAVFSAGAVNGATADVTVAAVNDRRVEQALESFAGQALSVTSTASASASTSQTIEVTDNDSAAVAITAPGTTSVTEGAASANVSVTLMLITDGSGTEQLDVSVAANLAGNADYAAMAALFGAGATSGDTADVMVAAVNDRNVEQASESFAGQALSATSTANVSASTAQAINVVDNDSASVAITVPGATSLTEGGGSANVGVTLVLTTDGTVGTAQLDVAVLANLPGNGDYTAAAALFGVGATSGATANVVVAALNDRNVEQATESFAGQALSVTSQASVSASTSQTINVTDNDSAAVAITAPGTTSVTEGGTANVGVTLMLTTDGTGTEQLDVEVAATLPGNLDYAAAAAVFGVGATSGATADLLVTAVNDRSVEQTLESFAGQALSVSSTAGASASTSQTIEVTDNDSAAVVITAPGTTSVTEGAASANVSVTLMLTSDGSGTEQLDVSVAANLAGNADYATSGVVFGAGAVSGATADLVVSAVNDMIVEQATETFAGQALSATSTASASASTSQTIEVVDNDTAVYTISDVSVSEVAGTLTFTVSVSNLVDIPVAINVSYTDQTATGAAGGVAADYDNALDQVVFAALDMTDKQLTVAITDDDLVEGAETFLASLSTVLTGRSLDTSDIGTGTIQNDDANGAPDAVDDSYTTNEDAVLTVSAPGVLGNDTDADSTLMAILETGPANGTLVFNSNGSFTYTPNLNFNGSDSFVYRASDGSLSDLATVSLTVNAVNDAPVGTVPGPQTAIEDTPLLFTGATRLNVADVDATSLTATLSVDAGALTLGGISGLTFSAGDGTNDGTMTFSGPIANIQTALSTVTFNPVSNSTATATLTLALSDNGQAGAGGALTDSDSVSISISAVNDAPVGVADSFTTDEDTALVVSAPGVLANDGDVDSASLTAELVSGPANGTLIFNGDGSFRYTPNVNFNGTDSFTYHATDGSLDSAATTVSLTVSAVNDAPVGTVPGPQTATEDTPLLLAGAIRLNVADVDATSLTATLSVTAGTLTLSGTPGLTFTSGDGTNDVTMTFSGTIANIQTALTLVTFNPASNSTATATLTLDLSDNGQTGAGGPLTDSDSVSISISPVNDAPDARNDSYTTDEDVALTIAAPGVLANDSDVDSTLTAFLVTGPANGTLVFNSNGSFTYTPNLNYNGADSFTYRASDGAESDLATVLLTVAPVKDAPVAGDDLATTGEDAAITIDVRANDFDIDGDPLTLVSATDAMNGTVVINADGTVTYTPDADFFGVDVFSYVASDGQATDEAFVFVEVNPVNDRPVAFDDAAATEENVAATIDVLGNDQDVEDDTLTVAAVTQGAHGTVVVNPDGTLTYTPNAGFSGTDSFEYQVSDAGLSDTGLVTITVDAADENGAPVFIEIADRTVTEGTEMRFTVSASDPDDAAGALVYTAADLPAGATFDPVTREFVWLPADDASATVTFTVLDPHGATDEMEVVLTATNVAALVDAGADQLVGLQKDKDHDDDDHGHGNKEATVDVLAAFNDLGTADTHTALINWGDGTVSDATVSESPFGPPGSPGGADGSVAGSHTYTKSGVYTVTVTVTDDDGGVRSDTLVVTVEKPGKALKGKLDKYEVMENGVLQVNAGSGVLSNDTGSGGTLVARLVAGPEHGALTLNTNGSFTYVPDAGFDGKDVFWYEFNNGSSVSKLIKVEFKVKDSGLASADGCGRWSGLPSFSGAKQQNFADFLLKLAAKLG